ncbi:MAG: DUF4349 domain-containing protein, partial [Ignavibacteria bacterium]|nr:DUF4349 domain-containing protein [Ignavibacteria bacterium]
KSETESKDVSKQKLEGSKNEDLKISERLVIKTGKVSIEVEKYDESEKKVNEITSKYNGYVASSNSSLTAAGKKQGVITLKVPAEKFDLLIAEITSIGKVLSSNISASDVTEEYIDLEARLKTQKELEERLLKLLSEKATKLSDVLEVEEKLSSVRQKIESVEGKMKYLKSQASYSTLTISLYEPNLLETSTGGGFFYELWEAIKTGLRGLAKVLIFLIVAIIVIIPFALFALLILWIIRRMKRKAEQK